MRQLVACALLASANVDCGQHHAGNQSTSAAGAGADDQNGIGTPSVASPTTGLLDGGGLVPKTGPAVPVMKRHWPSCDAGTVGDLTDSDAGPSPYQDGCLIDEKHGVFVDVARGDDAHGDGSRDAPKKSLGAAIQQAMGQGKHVYACAGVYEEPLLIAGDAAIGLEVYGGLSCETFLPDPAGTHTVVRAKGKGAALEIADTRLVVIERFDFENVAADDGPGTTYVGGFIQDAHKILLREVNLRAAPGQDGTDGAPAEGPAVSGTEGNAGANACAANPNPGAKTESTNGCFAQSSTTAGGSGGDGAIGTGNGGNGTWLTFSQGGLGETGAGWSCAQGMGGGPSAVAGSVGAPGRGATGFGALIGSGFVGFSGQTGMPGSPGYGGSGGGAAKAPATCAGLSMATGASAGSGGSGGCGGAGGKGGGPGGSSLGLVLIDSDVRLENGAIAFGSGGRGGRGTTGQAGGAGAPGGKGGLGSAGSKAGCDGTAGAKGGDGGPGGGGNGGHAIGVLYLGKAPKLIDVGGENDVSNGKAGAPGTGPDGVDAMLAPQLIGTEGVSAFRYEM